MRDYRSLRVWEQGHRLTLAVYADSRSFPPEERYGLTAQIRRSAMSIPSNIAEGCGRSSPLEYARFLEIAMSSANEVEYQLLLAKDLNYVTDGTHGARRQEVAEVRSGIVKLRSAVLAD